jgi:hypothetical protein
MHRFFSARRAVLLALIGSLAAVAFVASGPSSPTGMLVAGRVSSYGERAGNPIATVFLAHRYRVLVARSAHRQVSQRLKKHFRVIRGDSRGRAASDSTTMPLRIQGSVASQPGDLNVAQAAYVVSASGEAFWVVPGSNAACLVADSPTYPTTCGPISGAGSPSSGNFTEVEGQFGANAETVIGLAPDGNSTVQVLTNSGGSVTVPVTNNVYAATVSGEGIAVALRDASGDEVRASLPVP